MTAIHQNKANGMDPRILTVAIIGIIAITAIVFAFNAFAQPTEHVPVVEETVLIVEESPPIGSDATQMRLQEIADKNFGTIKSKMIHTSPGGLSMADFCDKVIIVDEGIDPLVNKMTIELGTEHGFYAGPLLFVNDEGEEVRLIESAAIFQRGGLLVDGELKNCKIITLNEPSPRFKEEFTYW